MTVDEIEQVASTLPERDRIDLAQRLFESLVGDDEMIGAWFDDMEPAASPDQNDNDEPGDPPPLRPLAA